MARTMLRYDLTESQEKVVVAYLKGMITGSSAARRLGLPHRQSFVNMFASVVQQWHKDGRLTVLWGKKEQ